MEGRSDRLLTGRGFDPRVGGDVVHEFFEGCAIIRLVSQVSQDESPVVTGEQM